MELQLTLFLVSIEGILTQLCAVWNRNTSQVRYKSLAAYDECRNEAMSNQGRD